MEGTKTWDKLARHGSSTKYTFFAPHDRAFLNVSEQVRATFENPQLTTDYANSVFSYHIGQFLLHCALASGAMYCNRSCLFVCVCGWVCYHDNSKLRKLILTKLGL